MLCGGDVIYLGCVFFYSLSYIVTLSEYVLMTVLARIQVIIIMNIIIFVICEVIVDTYRNCNCSGMQVLLVTHIDTY